MKALLERTWYDISSDWVLFIIKIFLYPATIILGMILAYYFYEQNVFSFFKEIELLKGLTTLYNQIGKVSLGLFPLTVYLLSIITQDIIHNIKHIFRPASRKGYYLILFAAPNLGLLGTFISLGNAFNGMDISQGLQLALTSLGADIGQALDSTKYGICLAIATYPFLLFINKDVSENDDEV